MIYSPISATTSANMWFLDILSKPARWANPGALILHLYGLLEPSDTRYTPNSPCNQWSNIKLSKAHNMYDWGTIHFYTRNVSIAYNCWLRDGRSYDREEKRHHRQFSYRFWFFKVHFEVTLLNLNFPLFAHHFGILYITRNLLIILI